MVSILRFRKICYVEPVKCSSLGFESFETPNIEKNYDGVVVKAVVESTVGEKRKTKKRQPREWRCMDNCCLTVGYICTAWWLLLFLYNFLPAALPGFPVPEPPGSRLRREGLTALHPVVLVPGIITGGLELWEGRPCSDGLFRKRLWGGSFTEIFKR